jgi:hypothetical protein
MTSFFSFEGPQRNRPRLLMLLAGDVFDILAFQCMGRVPSSGACHRVVGWECRRHLQGVIRACSVYWLLRTGFLFVLRLESQERCDISPRNVDGRLPHYFALCPERYRLLMTSAMRASNPVPWTRIFITVKLLDFVHRPDLYKQKTQRFGNWICFRLQAGGGAPTLQKNQKLAFLQAMPEQKLQKFNSNECYTPSSEPFRRIFMS